MENIKLSFNDIIEKIKAIDFGVIDLVVAIGRGGIVPGALVATILKKDFAVLWLEFRDDKHNPKFPHPKLAKKIDFDYKNKKILLVDDVSRTGATLRKAQELLNTGTKTFVINGKADYSLYDFKECIQWPWN